MAQSGHAISQFFLDHPEIAKKWNNNYLISLSIPTEEKLQNLLVKLMKMGISTSYFLEPDINNELTSICFVEDEKTVGLTSRLSLSLINHKN